MRMYLIQAWIVKVHTWLSCLRRAEMALCCGGAAAASTSLARQAPWKALPVGKR